MNSSDFNLERSRSITIKRSFFLVFYIKTERLQSRIGFKITKKVGNAVLRNRIKRLLRETFRKSKIKTSGYDMVFIVNTYNFKPSIPNYLLRQEIDDIFSKILDL